MGKQLGEVFCKVCNISSNEDVHFHKKAELCNRHWLQIKRHGSPTGNDRKKNINIKKDYCEICGDNESVCYYVWNKEDDFYGKTLCNKHYTQLLRSGKLLDYTPSKHIPLKKWTNQEKEQLELLYKDGKSFYEISKIMNRTLNSINTMSYELKLGNKYTRLNNRNYKAVYQNYDWCYERYIVKGMSHEDMATEAGCSLRTIKKWCSDIHHLNSHTFKENKQLTEKQKELIMFGLLGDGHIDKREDQPMYIELHAENQKEYLYWKYNILKDLCHKEPSYIQPFFSSFGGNKVYHCQGQYRLCTRIINELKIIKAITRSDIIEQLNEFGLSIHILDDAHRSKSNWTICLAEYSKEEIDLYIRVCNERFGLYGKQLKNDIYVMFDANSSRKIDQIILNNIPDNLDIIQYKIINADIHSERKYIYVYTGESKIGLNNYCRNNKISYLKAKDFIESNDLISISSDILNKAMEKYKYA